MPEPVRRMEVSTGAGRRRSWSAAEKASIIAESYGAGETVCNVARCYGLTPAAVVHLSAAGQAGGFVAGDDVRGGRGGAGRTGTGGAYQGAYQGAAPDAPPSACRWHRARDRRGRGSDWGGREAADHRGGDSRAQGELVIGPSGNVRIWGRRSRSTSGRERRGWRRWCAKPCAPNRSPGPARSTAVLRLNRPRA